MKQDAPAPNNLQKSTGWAIVLALCCTLSAGAIGTIPVSAQEPGDRERAFLAGETRDCSGCNLAGVSLKRRDLEGADLSFANLEEASFHDANLRNANLSGVKADYANYKAA